LSGACGALFSRPVNGRSLFPWLSLGGIILLLGVLLVPVETPGLDGGGAPLPWSTWLEQIRTEAVAEGIRPSTVAAALGGVEPIPRVLELDRFQPEFSMTFKEYLERVVSPARVQRGREILEKRRELLSEVGKKFGVQPRFLVALWGIETDFGERLGSFPVIDALATLAYDGRRSRYFRGELLDALRVIDRGSVDPDLLKGSWAGATGHLQFMPSSLRRNWVDQDGDGRIDIWTNPAEAMASGANYLVKSGWRNDQTWGRRVKVPEDLPEALHSLKVMKRLAEWQRLGVRCADGSDLPGRNLTASLIRADGDAGPSYLVYGNFRALLTWNRSTLFALAVGHFSDQLRDLESR